ncbi:MAG: hypothetical protein MUC65_03385 [Pontiellaceae bacterium]|nr:hypothetical protein [Pontiellaceae bacterium]
MAQTLLSAQGRQECPPHTQHLLWRGLSSLRRTTDAGSTPGTAEFRQY